MKVIMLKDVKGTGRANDVVEVNDGFARNFLIPKGFAQEATAQNLNRSNQQRSLQVHRKNMERAEALELAKKLEGVRVEVTAKAGKDGRLFGSVTAGDIADALKKKRIEVDKKRIELDAPIKQAGETQVSIRVYTDTTAKITVAVKIAE